MCDKFYFSLTLILINQHSQKHAHTQSECATAALFSCVCEFGQFYRHNIKFARSPQQIHLSARMRPTNTKLSDENIIRRVQSEKLCQHIYIISSSQRSFAAHKPHTRTKCAFLQFYAYFAHTKIINNIVNCAAHTTQTPIKSQTMFFNPRAQCMRLSILLFFFYRVRPRKMS